MTVLPGTAVDIPLPPALPLTFGYRGDARFVAFYWLGGDVSFDDGRCRGSANRWPVERYRQHPAVAPLLAEFRLRPSGWEEGVCRVLDTQRTRASVAPLEEAQAFLCEQGPPSPPLTEEQAEAVRRRIEGMIST